MKIQKFPFYNPFSNTLITSWFWSHRPHHIEQAGLKTDVLLAAYGYQHMDIDIVNHVLHNDDFHHTKFSINYLSYLKMYVFLNLFEKNVLALLSI